MKWLEEHSAELDHDAHADAAACGFGQRLADLLSTVRDALSHTAFGEGLADG